MTLKRHGFEGYEVGVTPTAGNSAAAGGDAFSLTSFNGATGTIVDSPVLQGARALQVTGTSVNTGLVALVGTASRFPSVSTVFRLPSAPGSAFTLASVRVNGGSQVASCNVNTGLTVAVSGQGGTGSGTSPALSVNVTYRLDLRVIMASSPTTSNGAIRARIVRLSDGVEVWSHTTDTANLGTSNPGEARFGITGAATNATVFVDTVSYDDNLDAFITPLSDFVAPVLAALVESPTGEIDLSWSAVPTATGYVVERSTTSATTGFAVVATLGAVTSWSDTGRPPSTQHWYRVKATK